ESAVYFVVREAVTNVVKHAQAAGISISIRDDDGVVVTEVVDDGDGGADQSGSGLQGLARRAGALDGRLVVDSPAGTGTAVRGEVPDGGDAAAEDGTGGTRRSEHGRVARHRVPGRAAVGGARR